MRRMILGGLLAAALVAPAVAGATPTRDPSASDRFHQQSDAQPLEGRMRNVKPADQRANIGDSALGGGMVGGNEPGHVTGPGKTPIDNDSRGPLNDVQPGRGSNDTRQSADPPPARY